MSLHKKKSLFSVDFNLFDLPASFPSMGITGSRGTEKLHHMALGKITKSCGGRFDHARLQSTLASNATEIHEIKMRYMK